MGYLTPLLSAYEAIAARTNTAGFVVNILNVQCIPAVVRDANGEDMLIPTGLTP